MKRIFTVTVFVFVVTTWSISSLAQTESREDILRQIETKRSELTALENRFMGASAEDISAYKEFLQQPDAGITRLLPRETFDNKTTALTTRGGGAYYSFTRRTHEYGWGTQIGFEQDEFNVSFAGADFGMLVRLGDVPLNSVVESPAASFLASYEPPSEEPQARSEYQRFAKGVNIEQIVYKTRQQAIINNTYVLRGIHYSDSDVLVAFRIVRKDLDGSVTILWKLLKQYPKPVLARAN